MKRILLMLIILTLMLSVNAGTIKGTVTEIDGITAIPGANVIIESLKIGASTDANGKYEIKDVPAGEHEVRASMVTFKSIKKKIKIKENETVILDFQMKSEQVQLEEITISPKKMQMDASATGYAMMPSPNQMPYEMDPNFNTESYNAIDETPFKYVKYNPLSTFSIDVDAASYSNMRRFINNSQLPPKDAVRIEEMINYFSYDYPEPKGEHPFSIYTEMSDCPWDKEHKLVHIGIKGISIDKENLPPSNLVFLLDVSGSMGSPNKLPLLKKAFRLLVDQLTEKDKVTIVVYAGAAGCVLETTPGSDKETILEALERLNAGGSTAGGAGIKLAYEMAKKAFIKKGNNRVILATDGDFNIGASSDAEMTRLIEEKRDMGIFLTVLGFGMGNYKDSKMEAIADKGNGNYAYIDNIMEAKKVLVNEMGATLLTIAKDVKIQVEFNPANVQAYRLIGYENRMLNAEDFADDKKDAGELGAGHTVTALYEIVPVGVKTDFPKPDTLRYQTENIPTVDTKEDEMMLVKFRYKKPDGDKSILIEKPVKKEYKKFDKTSDNFRFSAAVAGFGMLLRDSMFKGTLSYGKVLEWAKGSVGKDKYGYRAEFIDLVKKAEMLKETE